MLQPGARYNLFSAV